MPMTKFVRSAALTNFAQVARGVGLDPYKLVEDVGLNATHLMEQDLKIPVPAMCSLLENASALSGHDNFGLRLAETRRLSVLGHLGIAIREAPTFRQAIAILHDYLRFHNEALHMHAQEFGGYVVIRQEFLLAKEVKTRQAVELALGTMVRVMRIYLGEEWMPYKVCFSHAAPVDQGLHRRLFGTSLDFGHAFNAIICKSSDLDLTMSQADPVMARYALKQLELTHSPGQDSLEAEIRQWILISLPGGNCSVEQLTKQLGIEARTLHRRLMRDGLTFSDLVNQARVELCDRFIAQPHRKLSEIGILLGFSTLSVFSRWHQKQYGMTASERRKPS